MDMAVDRLLDGRMMRGGSSQADGTLPEPLPLNKMKRPAAVNPSSHAARRFAGACGFPMLPDGPDVWTHGAAANHWKTAQRA